MNHLKTLLSLFVVICISITPAFGDDSTDDDTARDDTQYYPVSDSVDMVSNLKFDYGKHRIIIKSVFPQLQSKYAVDDTANTNEDEHYDDNFNDRDPGSDAIGYFNQLVTDLVKQEITHFRQRVEEYQPLQRGMAKGQIRNDFYIDYDASITKSGKHPLISIRFTMQNVIAGMPHPDHYHRVLNFDLSTGQKIELGDLFKEDANYLAAFADYTSNSLLRHFKDRYNVMTGTAPKAENFTNWNIKPNGILITFDSPQVATTVHGTQSVLVPYSVLKTIIPTDAAIYYCVKNPKTCARNNLLVGGFIDTAAATPATPYVLEDV